MIGTYKTGTLVDYSLGIIAPVFVNDTPKTYTVKNVPGELLTITRTVNLGSGYPIGANWYSVENSVLRSVVYRLNNRAFIINKDGSTTHPSIPPKDPVMGIGGDNTYSSDKFSTIQQNQLNFPTGRSWSNTYTLFGLSYGWSYIADYYGDPLMMGNVRFETNKQTSQIFAHFDLTLTQPLTSKVHKLQLEVNTTHGSCFSEIIQISSYPSVAPTFLGCVPNSAVVDFNGAPTLTLSALYSRGTGSEIYYEIGLNAEKVVSSKTPLTAFDTSGFNVGLSSNDTNYVITITVSSSVIEQDVVYVRSWTSDGEPNATINSNNIGPVVFPGWTLKGGTKNQPVPLNLRAVCLTHGMTSYVKQDYVAPLRIIKNPTSNWGYMLFRQLYYNNSSYKYNYQNINLFGESIDGSVNVLTDKANVVETYEYWSNTEQINTNTNVPLHLFYLVDLKDAQIQKIVWYKNDIKISESTNGNTTGRIRQQTSKNTVWNNCIQWDVAAPYGSFSSIKVTDLILSINSAEKNNDGTLPAKDVWDIGLVFDNIQSEDVGMYSCEIQTTTGVLYKNLKTFYVEAKSNSFRNRRLLYDRKCNLIGAGANFTSIVVDHASKASIWSFGDGRYGQKGWTYDTIGMNNNPYYKNSQFKVTIGPAFKYDLTREQKRSDDAYTFIQGGVQNIKLGKTTSEILRNIYANWPKYVDTFFVINNDQNFYVQNNNDPNVINFTYPTKMTFESYLGYEVPGIVETYRAIIESRRRSYSLLSANPSRYFASITCGNFHQAGTMSVLNRYSGNYITGNNYYGQLGHPINCEPVLNITPYYVEYPYTQTVQPPNNFPENLLQSIRTINSISQNKKIDYAAATQEFFNIRLDQKKNNLAEKLTRYDSLVYDVTPRTKQPLRKSGGVDEWEGSTLTLSSGKTANDVVDYDFSKWDYILNPPTITVAGGNQTFSYKPNTPLVYALGANHYGQLGTGAVKPRNSKFGGKDYLKQIIQNENKPINIDSQEKTYTYIPHTLRPTVSSWRYYWNDCLAQDSWELTNRLWLYPNRSLDKKLIQGGWQPSSEIEPRFGDLWSYGNYESKWYVIPCTTGMTTTVINYAFTNVGAGLPNLSEYTYDGPRTGKDDPSWFKDYPTWPGSWSALERQEINTPNWKWGNESKEQYTQLNSTIWQTKWAKEMMDSTHFQKWKSGFLPSSPFDGSVFYGEQEYDFASRKNNFLREPCTRMASVAIYPLGVPVTQIPGMLSFSDEKFTRTSIPGSKNDACWGLKLLGRPRLDVIKETIRTDTEIQNRFYIGDEILYKWWMHPEGWTINIAGKTYSLDVITNDDIFGEYIDHQAILDQYPIIDYVVAERETRNKIEKGDANSYYPSKGVNRKIGALAPIGTGMTKIFQSLVRYFKGEKIQDRYYTNERTTLSNLYNRNPSQGEVKLVLNTSKPTTMFDYPYKWPDPLSITLPADPMKSLSGSTYKLPLFTEWDLEVGLYDMWVRYEKNLGKITPSLYKTNNELNPAACLYNVVSFNNKPWKWTEVEPQQVNSLSAWPKITKVSPGPEHTLFLDEDGSVYGCGDNEFGQLGIEKSKIPSFEIRDEGNGVSSFILPALSTKERIWFPLKINKEDWSSTSPESYAGLYDLNIGNKTIQRNDSNVLIDNFNNEALVNAAKNSSQVMPRYYFRGNKLLNDTQLFANKECTIKAHSLEDNILGQACPALAQFLSLTAMNNMTIEERTWAYNSFNTLWTPGYIGLFKVGSSTVAGFITNWFGSYVKDNFAITQKLSTNGFEIQNLDSKWNQEDSTKASNNAGKISFYEVVYSANPVGEEIVSLPKLIQKADESVNGKQFLEISAGKTHSLFLNKDNTVWYLGAPYGDLDNSNATKTLKQVTNKDGTILTDVVNIKAGWGYSLYLLSDGRVKIDGILGDWDDTIYDWGSKNYVVRNLRIQRKKTFKNEFVVDKTNSPITNIIDIAAGVNHCAFYQMDSSTGNGGLLSMGKNTYNQLGLGTLIPKSDEYIYTAQLGCAVFSNLNIYTNPETGLTFTDPTKYPLHPLSGSIFIGERLYI